MSVSILLFLAMSSGVFADAPLPVWIDADPAIGLPLKDVDDGLGLIQAFHSPALEIVGVSVVFGNAELEKLMPITREVVEKFGPPGLQVYAGAASELALGQSNDAVEALATALETQPLTIITMGPLTNIGSLLKRFPALHGRIEKIIVVAGRRPGQRLKPNPDLTFNAPDANFEHDPEAMRIILESDVPLVLTPWEATSMVWVNAEDIATLAASGPAGAWIAEKTKSWLRLWNSYMKREGFAPFDTAAVAHLTDPGTLVCEDVRVWMETGPSDKHPDKIETGEAPMKPYLLVAPGGTDGRRATFCYRGTESYKAALLKRLAGGE